MRTLSEKAVIGVVGAGAMGGGIAQLAATRGHPVVLFDSSDDQISKAQIANDKALRRQVDKGQLSETEAHSILKKISFGEDLGAFAPCSLVIEAVVESAKVKQEIFSKLETIVSADCILASNTSSLSIASIASTCKHPERVLGIHFFNPAPVMPLVEIIPGLLSDELTVDASRGLIDSWGKTTVLAKDTPGFIVNRIARPFYSESIRQYEEGIADIATIDWALKEIGGFRMGPFELMDFIGNDVNLKVTESVFESFFYDPRFKPSITQKRIVEARLFGRKTGRGYYEYAPEAAPPAPSKDKKLGTEIFNRVLAMLINEAADAVFLKIATVEDVDLAMTKGVNYPKGLLRWADEIGISTILSRLEALQEEYGEDRYRPNPLLKRMARNKETFYSAA
ncbi:MAG: 3-hydroxybutyryl-CoA dehydrogenase [Deltaproteobacteria bacterium]|nr:3-hydroxybutyryl-CoA dehydrogenase [Deltaproteobacteria bacterium]